MKPTSAEILKSLALAILLLALVLVVLR